ncbi:MAG: four helix bundle protein [Nitrospiraceae bacterium]|nr:MAG: four helix bundle protein [Nitrospiraceae bacterium]
MKGNNVVQQKSYDFALRIIKVYKYLLHQKKELVLSKQILRSGTSIGANVEEAIGSQSGKDFIAKLSIAYKEARETHYWIRLMRDSDYLKPDKAQILLNDCEELLRIIGSIVKTMKDRK